MTVIIDSFKCLSLYKTYEIFFLQEVILNCQSVSQSEKTQMDDRELDLQLGYILFKEVDWLSQNSSMYILILYQKCTGTLGLEIFLYKQNIDIIMVYQTIFYVLA